MANFGFAQQYQAPDYLTRSQAGLPVDPSMGDDQVSGMAASALAAPAPQRQQQQGGGLPDIPVSPLEAILAWAAHGGTPGEAAQNVRAVKLKNMMDQIGLQQAQQRFQLSQGLAPQDLLDYLTNPAKYAESDAKNIEPQLVTPGTTLIRRGGAGNPGGSAFLGPKTDVSPAGLPYAITDSGFHVLGPQLPGKISVSPSGALVDDNKGLTGQSVSIPNNINPGQTPGSFVPSLIGGKFPTVPAPAGGAAPPAPGAGAPATAPRGIRNNNFGNVKALPNGQAWQGQTGVDDQGHAIFGDPADGVRAAAVNLQSYGKEGVNTVAKIAQRWAGSTASPQTIANYTHFLAGAAGVDPNAPLDLADPKVQQPLLKGIFSFENGPQAMAAWRGAAPAPAPAQSGVASAPATPGADATSPGFHALGQAPSAFRPLITPQDRAAAGVNPNDRGSYILTPEGPKKVADDPYGPDWAKATRQQAMEAEPYKQLTSAQAALQALQHNIGQMTGPAAYTILDTMARTINPGAVARAQVIQTIEAHFGIPAAVTGALLNYAGHGSIPLKTQQQILDAVTPFAQSHWDQANAIMQANTALAKSHGADPADVTAPIGDRPAPMVIGAVPPPAQRRPNTIYQTPKGLLVWTGQGAKPWRQVN